jgi:hypothetical protein
MKKDDIHGTNLMFSFYHYTINEKKIVETRFNALSNQALF